MTVGAGRVSGGSPAITAAGSLSRRWVRLTTRRGVGAGAATASSSEVLASTAIAVRRAFDRDDVGRDGPDLQSGLEARDDLDGAHRAVQQQHLDQRTCPGRVAVGPAGGRPERLVGGGERAAARACASAVEPGRAPGLVLRTSR